MPSPDPVPPLGTRRNRRFRGVRQHIALVVVGALAISAWAAPIAAQDGPATGDRSRDDRVPAPSTEPGTSTIDAIVGPDDAEFSPPEPEAARPPVVRLSGDIARLEVRLVDGVGPWDGTSFGESVAARALDGLVIAHGATVSALFPGDRADIVGERAAPAIPNDGAVPDLDRWVVFEVATTEARDDLARALGATGAVDTVEAVSELAVTEPVDEWNQRYLDPAPGGVGAEWAWARPGGAGAGVTIALIDSGFDVSHPDLDRVRTQGRVVGAKPATNPAHGLRVLGIVVSDDDGEGTRGIVHEAGTVRANSGTSSSDMAGVIAQVSAVLAPGDVLSISQGICAVGGCADGVVLPLVYSSAVNDALRLAGQRGIITVVSAGNGGADLDTYAMPAGRSPNTVVVGAGNPTPIADCSDEDGPARSRVATSNYGSRVDLQGQGACVRTTALGGGYRWWGFTSAATPIVAGAAASLAAMTKATLGITLTGEQLRTILQSAGRPQNRVARVGHIGPSPDLAAASSAVARIPGNDMFGRAAPIGVPGATTVADTTWAGIEVAEPSMFCGSVGHTVWYRLSPSVDSRVRVDSAGSSFDTMLGLWRQEGADLVRVGCNDDATDGTVTSALTRTLEAGSTYYVQVGGRNGASGRAELRVSHAVVESARCDIDGDGRDDLVSGVPNADIGGKKNAGQVALGLGTAGGPVVVLDQESAGVSGSSEAGDRFGASVGCGDFDADGYDDLVVGSPGESIGSIARGGIVRILAGGPNGISSRGGVTLTQNTPGVHGRAEPGDRFGASVGVGDFNGDGIDDLAIGVPGEGLAGKKNTGAIHVLVGSPTGIAIASDRMVHQNTNGFPGRNEHGDRFGRVLAAGDMDGDGFSELAVGAPTEGLSGAKAAGAVWVLAGTAYGITGHRTLKLRQGAAGVAGVPERGDRFGAALATGDLNGDGRADLAIGVPGEGLAGASGAGLVHVVFGNAPLTAATTAVLRTDRGGVPGAAEPGDRFGAALVIGSIDGHGPDELVAGSPGEGLSGRHRAGAVHVFTGTNTGPGTATMLHQDVKGIPGTAEAGDQFGSAVMLLDLDGDGGDDLVIGVPGETRGATVKAGLLTVVPSDTKRLQPARSRIVGDAGPGAIADTGNRLGGVLG